jgi:hypothetical protein
VSHGQKKLNKSLNKIPISIENSPEYVQGLPQGLKSQSPQNKFAVGAAKKAIEKIDNSAR